MTLTKYVLIFLGWACALAMLAEVAMPGEGTGNQPDSSMVFLIETGSRLYPEWKEEHVVGMGERFWLGDTAYTATVTEFMSDFKIKDGKPVNWSAELNNPAVRVVVLGDSAAADTTWAFLNFPPHYSAQSFWTFRLKELRSGDEVLATAADLSVPGEDE